MTTLKLSKKLLIVPVLAVAGMLVWAFAGGSGAASADVGNGNPGKAIVGVWEVTADAPYPPHLFTFHADGTMTSTNPTNVQESASDPHGGTNDSLGMGVWKVETIQGQRYVVGTFEELNAFADNHQPTDTLEVTFKVTVGDNHFDGPAKVKIGGGVFDSHVTGEHKVVVDQDLVDTL